VEQTQLAQSACRVAAQVWGTLVVTLATAALAGWALGHPVLLGLRASYIPMAPNTALAFVVLDLGLLAIVGSWRGAHWIAGLGALLVGLVGLLRLIEFATGVGIDVDGWFIRVPAGRFGLAPIGKMSLPTASAFVAASTAMAMLAWPRRWNSFGHTAGACGVIAAILGLVFSLGYLFSPNSPLLYGTESIPMALNTALCFVALGFGLAAAAGPEAFPLLGLSGSSVGARLLRTFLPLVMATVVAVAWLTHLVTTTVGASSAALLSAALATAAIMLFGVLCERIAGRVGGQIDRAEAELKQARDELEVKVAMRTQELSWANGELARALRDSQRAHESLQQAHLELKQTQTRMLQQARLASLGQTAAGMAHEINNPLAFVTNNLTLLKREVAWIHDILLLYQQAEQTLAEYQRELFTKISALAEKVDMPFVLANLDRLLDRSQVGLLRIQKIVMDLRDFAHLEEADYKEVDLNSEVATTVRLMQTIASDRGVTLETHLAPIPRTTCVPAKINLVVQSLISNAIDASSAGAQVRIETRQLSDAIEIRVSDAGCGIPAEIRDRIFDPFFTTKPVGKGTGLGLSLSYGIVKDHGGTIEFESSAGAGTRFAVRLPVDPPCGNPVERDGPTEAREPVSRS
jgi:signal transduction histidine kinase